MAKYVIDEMGQPLTEDAKLAIRSVADALLPHSNMSGNGFAEMVLSSYPHNTATVMAAELIRQEVKEVSVKPLHGHWRQLIIKATSKGEKNGSKIERKVAAVMGGGAGTSDLRDAPRPAGHDACQGELFEHEGWNTQRSLSHLYGESDAHESRARLFA